MNSKSLEVFEYADTNYGNYLVKRFSYLRDNGLFFDVTLQTDMVKIPAHRALLAAFSEYFAALFGSGMNESGQQLVVLRDIDSDALIQIIDFAYTGRIKITPDSVLKLLMTADYLAVERLRSTCCGYLSDKLDITNVLSLLVTADQFGFQSVVDRACRYAAQRFEKVCKSDEFLNLPPLLVLNLVTHDCLIFCENGFLVDSCRQETSVLLTVLRYFEHNPESAEYLTEFLSHGVHLPLVSHGQLLSLQDHPLIVSSSDNQRLVEKALNWSEDLEPQSWAAHRNLRGLKFRTSKVLANSPAARTTGVPFDDGLLSAPENCMHVTGMTVYIRTWDGRYIVGGLKVSYSTGDVVVHGNMPIEEAAAAGDGLTQIHEVHLEPQERITSVTLRAGWMVDQIAFTTCHQRKFGPYGGVGGAQHLLSVPNEPSAYLAYIKGRVDQIQQDSAIRYISFVWAYCHYNCEVDGNIATGTTVPDDDKHVPVLGLNV